MSVGIARLREEPDAIRKGAVDKGEDPSHRRRSPRGATHAVERCKGRVTPFKAERNTSSKAIGEAIKGGAQPDGPEVAALRGRSTADRRADRLPSMPN